MLYIFLVGSGTMVTFDMSLACGDVAALHNAIADQCLIPPDQQVLLVSGGTALDPKSKVIEYSAGTDTNPIFLCTRTGMDNGMGSYLEEESETYISLVERVKACEIMTPDQQALTVRMQLAQDMAQEANNEYAICSQLVDSQHLQHQGWLAVMANLEDELKSLSKTFDILKNNAQQYFQSRPLYQNLLSNFHDALERLGKIPLLPVFLTDGADPAECHTLLTKFTEPDINLSLVADQCHRWVEQFNEDALEMLKTDVDKVSRDSRDTEKKEIQGIEDWLFTLNKKLVDAKEIAASQCQRAKSFLIKHGRLSSKEEASILQLLCSSHLEQLKHMLGSHNSIVQIHEQCKNAKRKLSHNLQVRISWVACIESRIFDIKNKLTLYNVNLGRLRDHLGVIEQMHIAPEVYVKTLVEIRRRKIFSSHFLKWASCVSEQASELHEKEVSARDAFRMSKSVNFIDSLFPGIENYPPAFATICPEPFDVLLPNITEEDLDKLKQLLPEFSGIMEVPLPDVMTHISPKSIVSDSAFSSEVPDSHNLVGRSISSASLQSSQMGPTTTMGSSVARDVLASPSSVSEDTVDTHLSGKAKDSLVLGQSSSSASLRNSQTTMSSSAAKDALNLLDMSSLTPEDVHKPGRMKTVDSKNVETFSPIVEEQNNVESDGEFETVDNPPKCVYDPFASKPASDTLRSSGTEICTKLNAKVEEIHQSPGEDRLRSPDSMLTSHDFHSADYFFDDSMPSSYTESTGMSALGKGQHMVKTHHVIVAELQNQLSDKNVALKEVQGSVPLRRSPDLMKVHATLSAFQKFVQDLREKTTLDLNELRESVVTQRQDINEGIGTVMKEVTTVINSIQVHGELEKSKAVEGAVIQEEEKYKQILHTFQDKLEVESNKLIDMCHEVEMYQQQIHHLRDGIDDQRHEFDSHIHKVKEQQKAYLDELKRELEIEHELELGSLRSETDRKLLEKDNEIARLREELKDKGTQIHMLGIEKENLELEHKEKMAIELEKYTVVTNAVKLDVSVQHQEEVVEKTDSMCGGDIGMYGEDKLIQTTENVPVSESCDSITSVFEVPDEEVLKHGLSDEKLFVPLYYELCRIWNVLFFDFGGEKCEDFPKRFSKSIKFHLEQMIEKRQSEIISERDCKDLLVEPLKDDHRRFLVSLATFNTYAEDIMNASNGEGARMEDLVKLNETLLGICKRSSEIFQNWGAMHAYDQRSIKECDITTEENKTEIARLNSLIKVEEEKHSSEVEKLKSLHIAEKQVSFNEVINKVTREKDEAISILSNDVALLEKYQGIVKSTLTNFLDKYSVSAESKTPAKSPEISKAVSKVLLQIKDKIEESKPTTVTPPDCRSFSSSSLVSRIKELEKDLKKERGKLSKIFEKVSKANNIKLALLTCDPGDVVLFCYDEKRNNYVAFHFGNTPHFLHTDGLKVLKLKIPPEGATTWAVGVVIDKEYYLAKKKPNRYNVRNGSVFYCVKVQSWSKGDEMRCIVEPEVTAFQSTMTTSESDLGQPSSATSPLSDMSASAI